MCKALPNSRGHCHGRGQLNHVGNPFGDVDVVVLGALVAVRRGGEAGDPGVREESGQVGPLGGILPQAAVDKVNHLGGEHGGGEARRLLVHDVLQQLEYGHGVC